MNLKQSTTIDTHTAFVFGKEGSGYDHLALQMAAGRYADSGKRPLVLACAAVDGLTGKSLIDRKPLPEFDYVEVTSVEDFEDVLAELNKMRAADESYDTIVFFGLAQFASFVANKLVPGGQPTQPQYGQIARDVVNAIRAIRGYARALYVTCDVRPAEDGSDRMNVQPAIESAVAGELAHAFYVAAKKDGTRLIQTDPLLALNFVVGGAADNGTEEHAEARPEKRQRPLRESQKETN